MSPYPDFQALSPVLHLYTPILPADTDQPGLIVLATWMNAPPRLINRYITLYRTHFPSSSILLITSSLSDLFWTSQSTLKRKLRPGISVLQSYRGNNGRVSAGIYSNGGSYMLTTFARLYSEAIGEPLPISGLFIDSAPGSPTDLSSGRRAILASLPPTITRFTLLRYAMNLLIHLVFVLYRVYLQITSRLNPITSLRAGLLDPSLFSKRGKRTYVYSKEDKMVDYRAVLSHAEQSKGAGWEVKAEEWVGSGHVAHMKQDGERYWRLVGEAFGM